MDNFERRLAASMKIAAEQRPDVEPESNRSSKHSAFMALAAAVVIGSLIAGTTWLFNPGDPSNSVAGQDGPCKTLIYEGRSYVRMQSDLSTGIGPLLGTGQTSGCGESEQIQVYEFRQMAGTGRPLPTAEIANWIVVKQEADEQSTFWAYEPSSNGPINLEGEWKVTALLDADGHSIFGGPEAQTKSISFEDGKLRGRAGCGAISGTYTLTGDNDRDLKLTYRWVSEGLCPDEPPLYARLRDVRHVSEAGGKLQLHAENWMIIAVLERADASTTEPSQYPTVPPPGDVAVWSVASGQHLTEDSTEFIASVTRLGCNGGVTGDVQGPAVVLREGKVVVSFTVPHSDGGTCPSNNAVPMRVRLTEPLGSRALVDGQCFDTRASTTAFCESDQGVRWPGN